MFTDASNQPKETTSIKPVANFANSALTNDVVSLLNERGCSAPMAHGVAGAPVKTASEESIK